MNRQHFQAFMALRWRLFVNQLRRGGVANVVILSILAVVVVLLDLCLFVGSFLIGWLAMPEASPAVIMYVWDGLVVFFLFWWGIGVITELQRSEALTLDKLLHLPVSLSSAFLINYLSSLLNLSMIIFLPAMLSLTAGLVLAKGPALLLLVPVVAGFFMMVTALTYQFQGWLASLMVNKRRRQTIIVVISMAFVLVSQLPNVANIMGLWGSGKPDARFTEHLQQEKEFFDQHIQQQADLREALSKKQITLDQFKVRLEKLKTDYDAADKKQKAEYEKQTKEHNRAVLETVEWIASLANLVLPFGWLPLSAKYLAEGNALPAFLGTLGFVGIGTFSLRRAYRTTLRYYTGQFSAGKKLAKPAAPVVIDNSPAFFMEKRIPWLSEQATVIALASMRSLVRAPEAKMMLMSPIIMVLIFGSMFMAQASHIPPSVWPFLPSAAMGMILFGMVQFGGNQFGFDRSGFRVFVLCPAQRHDILLGKNLAIAPLCLGLGVLLALVSVILFPVSLDHLLALPFQFIAMFLVFCLMTNWLSIYSPMAIRAGSFKAAQPKGLVILLALAFMFLLPLALAPTLLPLGIEVLLHSQGYLVGKPVCLALTLLEFIVVGILYRVLLKWQGQWLRGREQKILETVAVKSD